MEIQVYLDRHPSTVSTKHPSLVSTEYIGEALGLQYPEVDATELLAQIGYLTTNNTMTKAGQQHGLPFDDGKFIWNVETLYRVQRFLADDDPQFVAETM